jgi:hypothetical protein
MRLALAPEVLGAEEAQAVEAGVEEDTVVDTGVVGGLLGKRALGITESYQDFTHTLIIRVLESSHLRSVWQERRDRFARVQ